MKRWKKYIKHSILIVIPYQNKAVKKKNNLNLNQRQINQRKIINLNVYNIY